MTNEEIENKARKHSLVYDTKYAEDGVLEDMLNRPQDFVDGAIMNIVQLLREKANRDGFIDGAKEIQKENEKLKQQIEQMKCCGNCKHGTQGDYDCFENCGSCHATDCECEIKSPTKNSYGKYHDWDDKCDNWELAEMRCNRCPAYWEDRDYFYGLEDWGCYCDPKSGNDCGREFANGDYGCNRKLPYIQKVMKEMEKQRAIDEAFIIKQMDDMAKFFEEECKDEGK